MGGGGLESLERGEGDTRENKEADVKRVANLFSTAGRSVKPGKPDRRTGRAARTGYRLYI